jgi:hypothetical protein
MPPRHLLVLLPALLLAWAAPVRPAHADAGWRWPLPPPHQVLHGFAPPAHDWLPGHRGVDLAAAPGQAVVAAGTGRVAFAGTVGRVPVVTIQHPNGLETTYEPVRPVVRKGADIVAGAVIGHLVAGGHCLPATCLHWGLRRDQAYLDPLSLVGAAHVRLLPTLSRASAGSWLAPAAGGASVGSSAVIVGWALAVTRRRRRPLPPGVASLAGARDRRGEPPWRHDRRHTSHREDDAGPCA